MRLLAGARRPRGTRWDLFGRSEVCRTERALPAECVEALDRALAALTTSRELTPNPDNLETVVKSVALPEMVRSYEDIKLVNVAECCHRLTETLTTLEAPAPNLKTSCLWVAAITALGYGCLSFPPFFGGLVYAALACSYSIGASMSALEWRRRRLYHWSIQAATSRRASSRVG